MPAPHILANALLVAGCLALGLLAFRSPRLIPWLVTLGVALILLGWDYLVRPDLFVQVIPWRDWVFYRNIFAPGAAVLVPTLAALARTRPQRIRVWLLGVVLFAVTLMPYGYYLTPNAESRKAQVDENGIVIQTSFDSCSAAAAATLLRGHKIEATEAEIIRLALTKKGRGTEPMGLYRALRIKSRERPDLRARLKFLDWRTLVETQKVAVITVGLRGVPATDEELEMVEKYRWQPFVSHSVVFMGRDAEDPNFVIIADPSIGLERWTLRHLELLFRGPTFFFDKLEAGPKASGDGPNLDGN